MTIFRPIIVLLRKMLYVKKLQHADTDVIKLEEEKQDGTSK